MHRATRTICHKDDLYRFTLPILREFLPSFDCVKSLCQRIRSLLFLDSGVLDIGTSTDPPEKLYDSIIREYDKAIDIAKTESR